MPSKKSIITIPQGPINTDSSPFFDFVTVYNTYFMLYNTKYAKNNKEIFERRVNKGDTLEEIARDYGMTRERVRQIVAILKNRMYKLFTGSSIPRPKIRLDITLVTKMNKFINYLQQNKVLKVQDVLEYLKEPCTISVAIENNLNLLMFVLGYSLSEVNGVLLYAPSDISRSKYTLQSYTNKIESALNTSVLPISISRIVKETSIKKEFVKTLLPLMESVEIINDKYQLKDSFLSNSMDALYRIMREKKKPMRLSDIIKTLAIRGIKSKGMSNSSRINLDRRFIAIGKKSLYGLTEWNLDTRNYLELMEDILKKSGKPLSPEEITKQLVSIKKEFRQSTVGSYVSSYPNTFKKIKNGKIILSSWNRYKGEEKIKVRRNRHQIKNDDLNNIIIEILLGSKDRKAKSSEVYEKILKVYPSVSKQVLYQKITRNPIVKINSQGVKPIEVSLKENYKEILLEKVEGKRMRYIENIKNEAKRILKERGPMVMKPLVKELSDMGAKTPTIYRALDDKCFYKEPTANTFNIKLR